MRTCPARYRWAKIEKLPGQLDETYAQRYGSAGHKAIESLLRRRDEDVARDSVSTYGLTEDDSELLISHAWRAVDWVRTRGKLTWIEELSKWQSNAGRFTLWACFDAAVTSTNGLEVIDFTFSQSPRYRASAELAESLAGGWYRLVAGAVTTVRPIFVTDLHVPTMTAVSTVLDKAHVINAHRQVLLARDEIITVVAAGEFPTRPGPHCGGCPYRLNCPAAAAAA